MTNTVKPVPDGYTTVTPYLILDDAGAAIDFYKKALGATELVRMNDENGKVRHAELKIGNACIMLADEFPEMGQKSAKSLGGSPVSLLVYVEACDKTFAQAIASGAKSLREPKDQFYGDRSGTVQDPFGYQWHISTHVEDVLPEELERRMKQQQQAAA